MADDLYAVATEEGDAAAPRFLWSLDDVELAEAKHLPGAHDQQSHASGGGGGAFGSDDELTEARTRASAKIAAAPVPSSAAVQRARADADRESGRPGGESRGGSAEDRRRQRQNLYREFGGDDRGYVVCHVAGLKMHWTTDAGENPAGLPTFERDKIFTKTQGGGYQLSNLLPVSFSANRARGDRPLRPENLE